MKLFTVFRMALQISSDGANRQASDEQPIRHDEREDDETERVKALQYESDWNRDKQEH